MWVCWEVLLRFFSLPLVRRARLLGMLLAVLLSTTVQAQDFEYSITDGEVTITKYVGAAPEVSIPNTIEDLPVTRVAGIHSTVATSVTIPESVSIIDDFVFGYLHRITNITVSVGSPAYSSQDGVLFDADRTTLLKCPEGKSGDYAIPEGVTSIGFAGFHRSRLDGIDTGDSLLSIPDGAFESCYVLSSVVVGNSVTNIGDVAFKNCYGLTNIVISDSVLTIGSGAFSGCRNLSGLSIPETTTSIGSNAFEHCHGLQEFTIPDGVIFLGNSAFYNCHSLTNILIGNSVTNIGKGAFSFCSSLEDVAIGNGVLTIEDDAFSYCGFLKNIELGNQVGSIGSGVFVSCQSLTNVVVPDSVLSIGDRAFSGCDGLTSVTIGSGVTVLGKSVFSGCGNLTTVSIPDSVTTTGGSLFEWCMNLTAIEIGAGVSDDRVRDWFYDCERLIDISVVPENTTYRSENGVLFSNDGTVLVKFPEGREGDYVVPHGVTLIGESAFTHCAGLTAVSIPNSVHTIGDYAFYFCRNLENVLMGDGVGTIGRLAFDSCDSLMSITIPAYVTSIGASAFDRCRSLTGFNVDPANAFYSSAGGVLFNKAQTTLIHYPGAGDGSYTIPVSVTKIEMTAFIGIPVLTNIFVAAESADYSSVHGVLFDKGMKTLLAYPGGRLGNYEVPAGTERIEDFAFASNSGLTSIIFGDEIKQIGVSAFAICTNLTSVKVPGSVESIEEFAFAYCDNLESLYFEGNAPSFGGAAFQLDQFLTIYRLPDTTGWGMFVQGRPVELWLPKILPDDGMFGIEGNNFRFTIDWAKDLVVDVEASPSLSNPDWQVVDTITLTDGVGEFSDPDWADHPDRFYRLQTP